MFTRWSVDWADRIVATRSWNGVSKSSAQSSLAVPGKSTARRSITSFARPFGVLGFATSSTYRVARVTLAAMAPWTSCRCERSTPIAARR